MPLEACPGQTGPVTSNSTDPYRTPTREELGELASASPAMGTRAPVSQRWAPWWAVLTAALAFLGSAALWVNSAIVISNAKASQDKWGPFAVLGETLAIAFLAPVALSTLAYLIWRRQWLYILAAIFTVTVGSALLMVALQ